MILHADAQAPVAQFSASPTAGCGPLAVKFTDQSSGKPTSWTWDFGNGVISSQQNPNTTYTAPGTYTVTLIVKNAGGANSIQKTDLITVYPFPTTAFSADRQLVCAPADVQFTDLSTPGQGSIASWQWDFGDGTQPSGSQNPVHNYSQTGYYTVSLKVVNSQGCAKSTTASRYIRVVPGVQPDFSWAQTSTSCSAPFDIQFTNQTSGPGTLSYAWDLGNTNTSTATNPATTYPTGNPYQVQLTATSSYGCSASTTKTISFDTRKPVITAPDSACIGSPVSFVNGSSPLPASSAWNFGDGTTAAAPNPAKTFNATGTFTVTLTNNYGTCSSSTSKAIKIVTTPAIDFTADKTASCNVPLTAVFTDLTAGASSWQWDFGDGTTSTEQTPSHTYSTANSYNVSLSVVTNGGGCSGTLVKSQYINIVPPTATINTASIQGCTGYPVNPKVSYNVIDGVSTYQWNAPGATPSTSTAANPSFTYATAGSYNISLTITTNSGCSFQTPQTQVNISDPTLPVFDGTPRIVCAHQPVTFTSTSSPVDVWRWNFGDHGTQTNTPPTTRSYSDTGYFDVTLSVTHGACTLSHTETKYIYVNAPLAAFAYKTIDCINPLGIQFSDSSKFKAPISYKWDFGDPAHTTSTSTNPTFIYPVPGSYIVTLMISDNAGGCSDTVKKTLVLQPINVSFSIAKDTVCKGAPFLLTSTSTPANAVDSFSWTIGAAAQTPYFDSSTYSASIPDTGLYQAVLTVLDNGGCPHVSPPLAFHVAGPTAKFTSDKGGCSNSPISFTDQSIPYPGYGLKVWNLDYGDGTAITYTLNTAPFRHTYTDTGVYTVKLTVTDNHACTDNFSLVAATRVTTSHAGFFAADTVYCPNASLLFTDTSQGVGLTYSWDFGDGSPSSTLQNPTHSYTTDSTWFSVSLKVTDSTGCADSVTHSNYIHIHSPVAAFTMLDSAGICTPLPTTFIPQGQYYDSLYWNFGDGTTSNLDTVVHFYNSYRSYKATFYVQGAGGCRDSASRNVTVYNPYSVNALSFSPVNGCDSVDALFTIAPPPDTRFTLYFGDDAADSSNNTGPDHWYRFPSTYGPLLVLQDSTGCIVTINNGTVTVLGAIPIFSMDKHQFCDSGTVALSGTVISNDLPFTATWDFGDGQTGPGRTSDINQDTTHFYNLPGNDFVSLKISTASGCGQTYKDTVHIYPTPHPSIDIIGSQCAGLVRFDGELLTSDPDTVIWSWKFSDGQSSSLKEPALQFAAGDIIAYLQASVPFGCTDSASEGFTIHALPSINGPAELTTPVGIPVTIPFTYSPAVNSWSWTPATYLDCTNCGNPTATPTFATSYTVTVTDTNSCTNTASITVKTICNTESYFIPNTFSPNNDGVNDVFYPRGAGIYNIQSMRIFNRWGQMVFERKDFPANNASMGWDGNFNGHAAPSDAYIYIVEVICNNAQVIALKGDVTLIR